jgi:hypothetical protein
MPSFTAKSLITASLAVIVAIWVYDRFIGTVTVA